METTPDQIVPELHIYGHDFGKDFLICRSLSEIKRILQGKVRTGISSKFNIDLSFGSTMFENDKKISFNIKSEASYVYNLSGKKVY